MWQATVVAPQPPLAERKARVLPPLRVPPRVRLSSADLRSRACRRSGPNGGYRYSCAPARTAARMVSGDAVVWRATIMESGAADFTWRRTSSRASPSCRISSSTTSGRIRSRRSRKGAISAISVCSTTTRTGRSSIPARTSSESSADAIARPRVRGYMRHNPENSSASSGVFRGCGWQTGVGGRGRRRYHRHWHELDRGQRGCGRGFMLFPQLLHRERLLPRGGGNWSGYVRPGRPGCLARAALEELDRVRHLGRGRSGRNRLDALRRDQHHQFGVVSRQRPALRNLPQQRDIRQSGNLAQGVGDPVIQQAGDDEALAVFEFDFCLGAAGSQSRDIKTLKDQAVAVVERTDLRGDLQADGSAGGEGLPEVDAHDELTELDGYGAQAGPAAL